MLKKKRGCTSVQMISAYLSSLLPQDNHDGFVVTFGDDRFKHVLLHIWQGHTRVTLWSLHRVFLTLLKQYGKSKNVRLRRNSDSPSTIRPSSVRHTQEVGVRTSSTSICGDGKAFSFKPTGSWRWDRCCKSLQWLLVFQYLGVVVSASFEIFVYKSNLQISLKPRWRSWCFLCLFLCMLFSRNRNTDFEHLLLLWLKLLNSALQTQTLSMLARHVADVFGEVTIPKNNFFTF